MSSATEDAGEVRRLITQLFSMAGQDGFNPEDAENFEDDEILIERGSHILKVAAQFKQFPGFMVGQDSGQPWFLYWLTNALELLNTMHFKLDKKQKSACCSYLRQCWNEDEGGFAGAPGLKPHIASTYAAMLAIVNVGTEEAYQIVDVKKMNEFLINIKNNIDLENEKVSEKNAWIYKDKSTGETYTHKGTSQVIGTLPGSIAIHENGEMDMRGVYCALVVADILNLVENNDQLTRGMSNFIASCQTYEGGISYSPFGESHGGYTYCGLAALIILKETDKLDLDRCAEWLVQRQIAEEGGFNGRINKLVDSCYNYWQGATFELLDIAMEG